METTNSVTGTRIASIALLVWTAGAQLAFAQQPHTSGGQAVKTASFNRDQQGIKPASIRFGQRAAQVGDNVEQRLTLEMRLNTSLRQGNQLLEQEHMTMKSNQHRVITTTQVENGRATAVTVRFVEAWKQLVSGNQPLPTGANSSAPGAFTADQQPVHGRTYVCRREGGDDSKLTVTDEHGNVPGAEECEIVSQSMDMVGRSNPLADFLTGRTVTIGETLTLPDEAAGRLFNLGERFGKVNRFDLTLRDACVEDGVPCAMFQAHIDAASNDSSQMRLEVEGPLVIQTETGRAVRTELSGPLGMSETRGSYSTAQQLIGTGRLNMRIASTYGATKR